MASSWALAARARAGICVAAGLGAPGRAVVGRQGNQFFSEPPSARPFASGGGPAVYSRAQRSACQSSTAPAPASAWLGGSDAKGAGNRPRRIDRRRR